MKMMTTYLALAWWVKNMSSEFSDPPDSVLRAAASMVLFVRRTDVQTYVRTQCAELMTMYSAGDWWFKKELKTSFVDSIVSS